MICTLNIRFQRNSLTPECENQLFEKLEKINHNTDNDAVWHSTVGFIKNYRVKITTDFIYLTGSLTKFYHNNNVQWLSIKQMREALKMLIEATGLPIYRGEVMRIDVALNVLLSLLPELYLKELRKTPGYKLLEHNHGIEYRKATEEINHSVFFYDKVAELKKRDKATYEKYKGYNILRIEDRYLRRTRLQLLPDKGKFIVGHLLTTGLMIKLMDNWVKHYEKIEKNREPQLTFEVKSFKGIREIYTILGIESQGGLANALKHIDAVGKENKWHLNSKGKKNTKTSKVKDQIKKLYRNNIWGNASPYISELDSAVAESEQLWSWLDVLAEIRERQQSQ